VALNHLDQLVKSSQPGLSISHIEHYIAAADGTDQFSAGLAESDRAQ